MNLRQGDEQDAEVIRVQRKKTLADNDLVALGGLVALVLSIGTGLYSIFGVAWQTKDNAQAIADLKNQDIASLKAWIANHESRDADAARALNERLRQDEQTINETKGKLDQRGSR